jgi:hypothetical protein
MLQGFETLLSEQNTLNQKLDQVREVGGEFSTVATLWSHFHELMREQELISLGNQSQMNENPHGPSCLPHLYNRIDVANSINDPTTTVAGVTRCTTM